jgi:hypothetical protein
MLRIINLDSIENKIAGQYSPGDTVLVLCDATNEGFTVTLPDATALRDVMLYIKKTDSTANVVTVDTVDGQTIDGETSITLDAQYEYENLLSDTSNYHRVANNAALIAVVAASHARSHTLLATADHSDVATYLDQAVLVASNPTFAGAILTSDLILPKTSGKGIKIDTAAPTFGWRDITGKIRKRGVGATDPADAVYIGGSVKQWQFSVNDEVWLEFHIPHDYVPGTDIHLHFHWSHNVTVVTGGNVVWGANITYAKGHNQAAFSSEVNPTIQQDASTTQYQHMIAEVQISAASPGATQIDTDLIEPDGLILTHVYLSANNMTASNGVPDPFLHEVDVHYQSTNMATKNKVPNFYS